MADDQGPHPALLGGYYKGSGPFYKILHVEGEKGLAKGSVFGDMPVGLKYGQFGEADPIICEATGESSYNVELSYDVKDQVHIEYGVVTEAGAKLLRKSVMGVHDYEKISEKEANEVLDDGDPIDSLPTPYKLQPHNQGHLIWFSGPPYLHSC